MSLEKNFETYKDQYRNRGKVEDKEEDIPNFRSSLLGQFLDEGKRQIERNGRAMGRQLVSREHWMISVLTKGEVE